jgi:hypothetical protein
VLAALAGEKLVISAGVGGGVAAWGGITRLRCSGRAGYGWGWGTAIVIALFGVMAVGLVSVGWAPPHESAVWQSRSHRWWSLVCVLRGADGYAGRRAQAFNRATGGALACDHAAVFQSMTMATQACCSASRRSRYGDHPRRRSAIDTSAASAASGTVKPALMRPFEVSTNTRRRRCDMLRPEPATAWRRPEATRIV